MPTRTKGKVAKQLKKQERTSSSSTLLSFLLLPVLVVLGGCAYAWYQLQRVDRGTGDSIDTTNSVNDGILSKDKKYIDGVRIQEPRKSWNTAYVDSRIGKQRCDLAVLDMRKGSLEAFEKATSLNAFYPIIIRNAMNNWPAMSSSWNYDNFLRKYGDMQVTAGVDIDHAYDLHKNSGEANGEYSCRDGHWSNPWWRRTEYREYIPTESKCEKWRVGHFRK